MPFQGIADGNVTFQGLLQGFLLFPQRIPSQPSGCKPEEPDPEDKDQHAYKNRILFFLFSEQSFILRLSAIGFLLSCFAYMSLRFIRGRT